MPVTLTILFFQWIMDTVFGKRVPAYPSDYYRYSMNGQIAVDHIGRFENLQEELQAIFARIGVVCDVELPAR